MTKKKQINFTDEVKEFSSKKVAERFKEWKCSAYCGWGVGPGWQPILYKLCTHIEQTLDRFIVPREKFVVAQVKEKFGTLRFYWEFRDSTPELSDKIDMAAEEIHEWVRVAEDESAKTCEFCGQPGQLRSGGWVKCTCDSCEEQDVHWTDVSDILGIEY